MTTTNSIVIERRVDGKRIVARANYRPDLDGWVSTVARKGGRTIETRDPDQTGNDVWATLIDMIDLTVAAQ